MSDSDSSSNQVIPTESSLETTLDELGRPETEQTQYKTSFTAIRKARRFALQGLYSWSMTDLPVHEIEAKTRAQNAMHTVHLGYYHQLLHEISKDTESLDALIESAIDRPIAMITKIELAVLRIGVWELKYRLEIPFKVVIDEAIQLNEHFGSDQGYRFINAVMDKLASELRVAEVAALEASGGRKPQAKKTPSKPLKKVPLRSAADTKHQQNENPNRLKRKLSAAPMAAAKTNKAQVHTSDASSKPNTAKSLPEDSNSSNQVD